MFLLLLMYFMHLVSFIITRETREAPEGEAMKPTRDCVAGSHKGNHCYILSSSQKFMLSLSLLFILPPFTFPPPLYPFLPLPAPSSFPLFPLTPALSLSLTGRAKSLLICRIIWGRQCLWPLRRGPHISFTVRSRLCFFLFSLSLSLSLSLSRSLYSN